MITGDTPQTYYTIYNVYRDKMRSNLNNVAQQLGLSGRGRSKKTASKYVLRMYEKQISLRPNLILRTFENSRLTAFFLKVKESSNVSAVFDNLRKSTDVTFVLLLSGNYDFFVTTRNQNFRPDSKARISKKIKLYTPIYTVPTGWDKNVTTVLRKQFAYSIPKSGKLERTVEDFLYWNQTHFKIYNAMSHNAQLSFTSVSKKIKVSANTVKKHFFKNVLPCCNIGHYFFPEGYPHYSQSLILLKSDYEIGLTSSLSSLPCTSYVYPFEDEIGLAIFHEDVQDLLFAFKKLEERGYIKRYMLLTPLHWE
jgi:DNA-binding Lrp family transcriptional regulator